MGLMVAESPRLFKLQCLFGIVGLEEGKIIT